MTTQGALNELNNLLEAEDIPVWYKTSIKKVAETIKTKSMPKMGKWVHMNDDFNDWLECSVCEYGSEGEVPYGKGTRCCPWCGTRMTNYGEEIE